MCSCLPKQTVKQYFIIHAKFTEYASAKSFKLEFDDIKVMIPDTTGWIVEQHGEVSNLSHHADSIVIWLYR